MEIVKTFLLIIFVMFIGVWYLFFTMISWNAPFLSYFWLYLISFSWTIAVFVISSALVIRSLSNNYSVTTDSDGNVSVGDNTIKVDGGDGHVSVKCNFMWGNNNEINVVHNKRSK